jgi:hypothetical protein
MFVYPRYGMVDRDEDRVNWSELLDDPAFRATLESVIGVPEPVSGD